MSFPSHPLSSPRSNLSSRVLSKPCHAAARGAVVAASTSLAALLAGCGGGSAGAVDPAAAAQEVAVGGGAARAAESASAASADAGAGNAVAADKASAASVATPRADAGAPVPVATGSGLTYLVGTAPFVAGATRVASMMAVPWSSLPAGSVVLVSPGTYPGVTTITATGTAVAPIIVTASDPTQPPVLDDSVDIQRSSYLTLSHLTVQSPTYAGFIIRLASNHVTVSDSTINQAPMAVNITDAAGTGHQILRNTIADSTISGINAEVNSDPAERTLIQSNTIVRSGGHGMEVRASHYLIANNTVSASGSNLAGGISGIHIYSGSSSEDSGDDNIVRYNLSYSNIDRVHVDGNGIEIDQWCNDNVVAYNQVWGNDGAGIIVFDGSSNSVQNNTAFNDGLNTGGTHGALGEIIVSGTSAATVHGNHVWNNIATAVRANVPAMYVDSRAVSGGNTIGANMYYNTVGGAPLRWTDSSAKQTAAAIDAATGIAGSVVATPNFVNAATASTGGLKLKIKPALDGVLPTGALDFAGVAPVSGLAFFGAYYTAPAGAPTLKIG